MNIQIFGKAKCFDTKKAERFFKERGVKYQFIDLPRFGMSEGEYRNIKAAVGHYSKLIDKDCKLYDQLHLAYLAYPSQIEEKVLENPGVFLTPIVRNGRQVTVGYEPVEWQRWLDAESGK